MKAEIFKSEENSKWYFHIVARNGKIVAQSQGYKSKKGALKGVRALHIEALKSFNVIIL